MHLWGPGQRKPSSLGGCELLSVWGGGGWMGGRKEGGCESSGVR